MCNEPTGSLWLRRVLRAVVGKRFVSRGTETRAECGDVTGSISGVVRDCYPVEIESRVAKQDIGALLDLLLKGTGKIPRDSEEIQLIREARRAALHP